MTQWCLPSDGWKGWTAGIIDGEGSIGIVLRKRRKGRYRWERYEIRVTLSNTDIGMVQKLKELWGGSYRLVKRNRKANMPCYHYCCSSNQALGMLDAILPWLITKKPRPVLAHTLQTRISAGLGIQNRWRRMSSEERNIRHQMYLDMKSMSNATMKGGET